MDAEGVEAEPAPEPTGIPIITCIDTTKEDSSVASSAEKLDTEENLTSSMELETEENKSNPGTGMIQELERAIVIIHRIFMYSCALSCDMYRGKDFEKIHRGILK